MLHVRFLMFFILFTPLGRPKGMFDLIYILNDKQNDDVQSIGFGGLLDFKLSKLID